MAKIKYNEFLTTLYDKDQNISSLEEGLTHAEKDAWIHKHKVLEYKKFVSTGTFVLSLSKSLIKVIKDIRESWLHNNKEDELILMDDLEKISNHLNKNDDRFIKIFNQSLVYKNIKPSSENKVVSEIREEVAKLKNEKSASLRSRRYIRATLNALISGVDIVDECQKDFFDMLIKTEEYDADKQPLVHKEMILALNRAGLGTKIENGKITIINRVETG